MENIDGTIGRLGGEDDKPDGVVRAFQVDYNTVSFLNDIEDVYPGNMGGLDDDGLVGPFTLNALRYAIEHEPAPWGDIVQDAELKGV